jgi:hypothetical protein
VTDGCRKLRNEELNYFALFTTFYQSEKKRRQRSPSGHGTGEQYIENFGHEICRKRKYSRESDNIFILLTNVMQLKAVVFILLCKVTVHVSGASCTHHQEYN